MACDFYQLATPGVQGLHPYLPGKPVDELERELGISNSIKLASNENPLGPSAKALDAISAEVKDSCRYPDANGFKLKQALSERYSIETSRITLGNGSNDVLELIGKAFIQPGDEVIYSQHAFVVYMLVAQSTGAKAIVTPAQNWGHDLDAMAAAITDKTRIIFLANPNNPTGTWFSEQALRSFMTKVPDSVVVVLDEAYTEYVDQSEFPDGLKLQSEYDNLVVTRTFSKAFGLAALRVGYAVASEAITDLLNRVRQPFNVNSLALVAAQAVLSDTEYLQRSVTVNNEGMAQLEQGFKALGLEWVPSVGNFISVDCGKDAMPVYQALLLEGVIVRPVANYQMPNHLRVTIGLPDENSRCLEAFAKVLNS
ncbi:histidinol-phosphate transaminase [Amphritea balenae]|uniref:Histidinol-phosphate aminotransferase n=1 Tax=Amphritea balenae TaxID=452629 RepID=A0A3P1SLC7_9GAMM|nr:histidinol-phosphate transaminase [Amphritea balenae]RRC97545.1 histidinol-phosphate transaminase [Amphritea balenae]GGK74228.1 histidinol-phosphate aminotransferase 2 [Amphritea balenae]